MSTQKVSDLAALTTAADDDLLLISDISETESKKITVANLVNAPVATAVAALVDSAPATLDTLNELAAALGDDANFSTTVTTSIGTKWTQDNTKITNWDTAYGWGNHASAGYTTANSTTTFTNKSGNISQWTNDSGYLTSFTETNDLTAAVTWANIPDANVPQSAVTQHQAALSITESQISNLGTTVVLDSDIGVTVQAYNANLVTYATNGNTAYGWGDHASAGYATYPTQTGNSGKYLTTDGSTTSWATVDALPDQTGNSGKYLTTDGSAASWAVLDTDANTTTKGLYEMANTISANYSITSGNNAMSAGPITVASGVTVTVPTGSRWVIV